MFVPLVAKAHKPVTSATDRLASQRSSPVARPFGHGAVEQEHALRARIGNQATLRLLGQRDASLTGSEHSHEFDQGAEGPLSEPAVASQDFSSIPASLRVQPNRSQALSPFAAPLLSGPMHTKLAIGRRDDPFEHEADRIADDVMRMPDPQASFAAAPVQLSRKCAVCAEEDKAEMLRSKPAETHEADSSEAPGLVQEVLRSPAAALDRPTRSFMEPRFGHDFGHVRVHTDARAAESAYTVGADAYTVGSHIVFAEGKFAPNSAAGRRLLAHELCHVVQQSHAMHLQRQEAPDASTVSPDAGTPAASVADQLLELADQVGSAQSGIQDTEASARTAEFADRLRAVAYGDDADEQMRVLAAFTTPQLARIDQKASQIKAARPGVAMQKSPTESRVSDPADAAEIEAARLAAQVASGGSATVREVALPGVYRQGAEAALAALTAFELGGGAEVEAATGPPGWVVGGLVLLAIGGLTILTMARARAGTCSCQHRDVFTSGGRSCLELRTSGVCTGPYTGVGADTASCQANARASAPPACRGCLGHCLFRG